MAACSESPRAPLTGDLGLDGEEVVIELHTTAGATVVVDGEERVSVTGEETFRFPFGRLGGSSITCTADLEDYRTGRIYLQLPEEARANRSRAEPTSLTLRGCVSDYAERRSEMPVNATPPGFALAGDFGGPTCYPRIDGTIELSFEGPAGTEHRVGGETLRLAEDGRGTVPVELSSLVRELPLEAALDDSTTVEPLRIPVDGVSQDGQPIHGEITLTLTSPTSALVRWLFAAVAEGRRLHPEDAEPGAASLVALPARSSRPVITSGQRGTVGTVTLVAMPSEGQPTRRSGTCGPYRSRGNVPRDLVPLVVTVYDAHRATEVRSERFDRGHECPAIVTDGTTVVRAVPPITVARQWLASTR